MLSKSDFINKYIVEINSTGFKNLFKNINNDTFENYTDFENFIKNKTFLEYSKYEDEIFEKWKNLNFVKARIDDLAIEYKLKGSNLKELLLKSVGNKLCVAHRKNEFDDLIDDFIKNLGDNFQNLGFSSIQNDFKKVFCNSLHFNFQRGFPINLENLNSGVMVANAGDSHQFLFLARAILAGYECSNVDVRSSRYDAIIDYKNRLFKIQVKGITSSTSSISFRDRDRGGQGIDHNHERNKGKKITSKDCDIYAAVDKNSGVCYLIPMKWVDKNGEEKLKMKEVSQFKEKWDVFNLI
tara:strand:+ start:1625 stop:2512 length:888 start_codon:yes stop_codon:yes gene_type:complete